MARRIYLNDRAILKTLIIHHTAGNKCKNWSDDRVENSLSNCGYKKGFKKQGYNRRGYSKKWGHWPNTYKDRISFSMYHYTFHEYTQDKNIYGWRAVQLIDDPIHHDAGSTSKVRTNEKAIAISFCGNYVDGMIDTRALQLAANTLAWLYRYTRGDLKIIGHKDIDDTLCPGRIYDQLFHLAYFLTGDIPLKGKER